MHSAPDASGRLRRAFYDTSFEGLDLRARGLQKQCHLFLDPIHLQLLQWYHFIPVVHCAGHLAPYNNTELVVVTVKPADNGLLLIPLLHHDLNMRVLLGKRLDVVVNVRPCVCGRRPLVAVLEHQLPNVWQERGVSISWPRTKLCP